MNSRGQSAAEAGQLGAARLTWKLPDGQQPAAASPERRGGQARRTGRQLCWRWKQVACTSTMQFQ